MMISFSSIRTINRSEYFPSKNTNTTPPASANDRFGGVSNGTFNLINDAYVKSAGDTYTSPDNPNIHSPLLQKFYISALEKRMDESRSESPIQPDGNVRLKIGYINDVHGQYTKLAKIGDALRDCDLRFSGGDNMIGDDRNKAVNDCVLTYMDGENFESSALGNHDVDMSEKNWEELTQNLKMKYLAANFKQDSRSKVTNNIENGAYIHDELVDSYIGDYKGVKYGVVGVAPVDMRTRMTHPDMYKDFTIDNMEDTIKDIQEEVDDLKKKDVKHIFLLSHVGHLGDRVIAENTSGIDVIIGGHSHTYVNGIVPGENLFLSKDKEPVLITNAEKDGNYYGKAELVFDKDGVLIGASNNLYDTNKRHRNLIYKNLFREKLGNPEKLGVIGKVLPAPKERLKEENPHAHLVSDAMRYELNADIGLLNAGNVRNAFESGEIDTSDTKSVSPFGNGMVLTTINEKDLVDGIKLGAKSEIDPNGKPGLFYASGLKYTVRRSTGEVLDMEYEAKDGTTRKIDVNNPDKNRIYTVAGDDFVLSGGDGIKPFNQIGHAIQKFDFDKDKLLADYIRHHDGPVDVTTTGRINIVD